MRLSIRRILASALENLSEGVVVIGNKIGDTILTAAVEMMPPKPPKRRGPAVKKEPAWWERVGKGR